MPDRATDKLSTLLEAASFAARAHRHQLRKDGATPYSAHPFRVCLIVRHVFGIDDPDTMTVALLHDTIEDTTTDVDDLVKAFGPVVASRVAALSKDKRLPESDREATYMAVLAAADAAVKTAKLADIFDNLTDSRTVSPANRLRSIERSRQYLTVLANDPPDAIRRPLEVVTRLLEQMAAK